MSDCKRCGRSYVAWPDEFCFDCQNEWEKLVSELKAGFIADWKEENAHQPSQIPIIFFAQMETLGKFHQN